MTTLDTCLTATELLEFGASSVAQPIEDHRQNDLPYSHQMDSVYDFVRDDIAFCFNRGANIVASEVPVDGYESDIPPFEGILFDNEIAAVMAFIKSTWPKHERGFQANVTINDEGGS